MDWNHVALISYGFLLGLILLLIAYVLFMRVRRQKEKEPEPSETPRLDFQQIERLVRLHQDVKDDLSNIGDALVAMRNEWLAAQSDLQRQIDALGESSKPAAKKSRAASIPEPRQDPHEQVQKLARFGMEPDLISQKTGLSRGEIDLILRMQGQTSENQG